ncbi:MAG: DNA double-strand break repair nuclease NurA [Sphingomonadaceae bacterium]
MLYPEKVKQALEARLAAFQDLESRHHRDMEGCLRSLERLGGMSRAEIEARLEGRGDPGALPSEEHGTPLVIPFGQRWANHQEARAWAFQRIQGITTLAVDGSQIPPSKDYSFRLAAIQVAWFENPHSCDGKGYVKDASFELLAPAAQREQGEEAVEPGQDVQLRRFEAEVSKIVEHMQRWHRLDPPPVAFFDGTLAVSFAASLPERLRVRYVGAILRLLRESREHRVPLVGFVDTSHSTDLCTLLSHIGGVPKPEGITDGLLLRGRMEWGDRTRAFVCGRDQILGYYRQPPEAGGEDYSREVAFFYLQTTGDGPPARVDVPRWVVREGLADYVADAVRCEVIAGTGYPYCFEAVDAAAVLSVQDREMFYAQVQSFCEQHGMRLRIAPKAASKRRRRV